METAALPQQLLTRRFVQASQLSPLAQAWTGTSWAWVTQSVPASSTQSSGAAVSRRAATSSVCGAAGSRTRSARSRRVRCTQASPHSPRRVVGSSTRCCSRKRLARTSPWANCWAPHSDWDMGPAGAASTRSRRSIWWAGMSSKETRGMTVWLPRSVNRLQVVPSRRVPKDATMVGWMTLSLKATTSSAVAPGTPQPSTHFVAGETSRCWPMMSQNLSMLSSFCSSWSSLLQTAMMFLMATGLGTITWVALGDGVAVLGGSPRNLRMRSSILLPLL
mmetsp:Transcript_10625/g.18846  ORF Transcript_10625/g.18846 Transcript_10625/m.18846 type:complete len:276 (+) Transcript_10625:781-1608(+)